MRIERMQNPGNWKMSDEDLRPIVLQLAKMQIDNGHDRVQIKPIALAIYSPKGGKSHRRIAKILDDANFPRVKRKRPARPIASIQVPSNSRLIDAYAIATTYATGLRGGQQQ